MMCYRSSSTLRSISQVLPELWPFMFIFCLQDFVLSCFELLNSKFIWSISMKSYRSSSSFSRFGEFLEELWSFFCLENLSKYSFPDFIYHALSYWIQNWFEAFYWRVTDQVQVSICLMIFCHFFNYKTMSKVLTGRVLVHCLQFCSYLLIITSF